MSDAPLRHYLPALGTDWITKKAAGVVCGFKSSKWGPGQYTREKDRVTCPKCIEHLRPTRNFKYTGAK